MHPDVTLLNLELRSDVAIVSVRNGINHHETEDKLANRKQLNAGKQALNEFHGRCAESPNDPKLSDGGAWRGACPTVERTKDAQM